jgi:hypothetical protein
MIRTATAALALALIAVVAASGCGGGSEHPPVPAETLLRSAAAHPVQSAQLDAELSLRLAGVPLLSSPATLRLHGPYVSGHGLRIPSFDWRLGAKVAGFGVSGRISSTGRNVFVSLYGDNYEVGRSAVATANQRLRAASESAAGPLLGLHPLRWFAHPRYVGAEEAGGVDCGHVSARIRTAALAADLRPVAARLGQGASPAPRGTVEAWVGFDDHTLHRLRLDAVVPIPASERARLGGVSLARLSADLTASDVGERQEISIPGGGGYKPIRDLFLNLNDLGVPGLDSLGLI